MSRGHSPFYCVFFLRFAERLSLWLFGFNLFHEMKSNSIFLCNLQKPLVSYVGSLPTFAVVCLEVYETIEEKSSTGEVVRRYLKVKEISLTPKFSREYLGEFKRLECVV